MGKLGKKARKFAKKHLQSVLRTRRKNKALFKKKSSKGGLKDMEEQVDNPVELPNGSGNEYKDVEHTSLDAMFAENDKDEITYASDSDGYLSEDLSCPQDIKDGTEKSLEDEIATSTYSFLNEKLYSDLASQSKKLDKMKRKDPDFNLFLENYASSAAMIQKRDPFLEENTSDQDEPDDTDLSKDNWKPLTNSVINTWCQMIREHHDRSAFICLLNAYRSACHYGVGLFRHRIENRETFCNILIFTLSYANDMFQGLLQLSSLNNSKETLLELKKSSKWESVKPLIKSFVRSTLVLLSQVTDADILAFIMTRLRASLTFFIAFPPFVKQLLKVTVHLWATSGAALSTSSFLVMWDVAAIFGSNFFDTCLSKAVAAFILRSRIIEIADIRHMQFLRDSIIDLCSLDVQTSSVKATASVHQLAMILQWGVQTKKKEAIKRICSWEFINCIDLWVKFISANICFYDLQSLFFMSIGLINALAHMFSGPRYFPLRLKCIGWLNHLSSSSGTFIPLTSLVLDILEYKVVKDNGKVQNTSNIGSTLKLPKHYLKSNCFQEECLYSAIEQLSLHFSYWSYHISFPELANIPLIRLRKLHETTVTESLRRMVKRFIDQVEQNMDFVQKRRDEVSFSPHDHQSVESFLQSEKQTIITPFTNYYKSVLEKCSERSLPKSGEMSLPQQKNLKINRLKHKRKALAGLHDDASSVK